MLDVYFNFLYTFPNSIRSGIEIILLGILLAAVSFFIWTFYHSISKRDILELNLSKYNTYSNPTLAKLFASVLYIVEYIVIIPALLLVWFTILTVVISLIASDISTFQIVTIVAAMLVAIRLLSYHKNEIAKDLAKLFPFITLSVFLISADEIDGVSFAEKIVEIPKLFDSLIVFFLSVFIIEVILRVIYTLTSLVSGKDIEDVDEE